MSKNNSYFIIYLFIGLLFSQIVIAQTAVWPKRGANCQVGTESTELLHGYNQYIRNPLNGGIYLHDGIDIQITQNVQYECVVAPLDGIVEKTYPNSEENKQVDLKVTIGGNTRIIGINHLKSIDVNEGDVVVAGQKLGSVSKDRFNIQGIPDSWKNNHAHIGYWDYPPIGSIDPFLRNPFEIWSNNIYKDPQGNAPEIFDTNGDGFDLGFVKEKGNLWSSTPPEKYYIDNEKAFGGVDIVVEAVDKQASTAPWQIPKEVGYYVQKQENSIWTNVVRSPSEPYKLINTSNWFGAPVFSTNETTKEALILQGPTDTDQYGFKCTGTDCPTWMRWQNWFTWIVTNTGRRENITPSSGTTGIVDDLDPNIVWATDSHESNTTQNGYKDNYIKATNNENAKFKEGRYRACIYLADFVNTNDQAKCEETFVDNYVPYIKEVIISEGGTILSHKKWIWDASGYSMCLNQAAVPPQSTTPNSALSFIITTSEPMSDLSVSIPDLNLNNIVVSPINSEKTQWQFTTVVPDGTTNGLYKLNLTGHDLTGNGLEALVNHNIGDCLTIYNDIPMRDDKDNDNDGDFWSPNPNPGTDLIHDFLVEDCSSQNDAPFFTDFNQNPITDDIVQVEICMNEELDLDFYYDDDESVLDISIVIDAPTLPPPDNFDFPPTYLFYWDSGVLDANYLGTHIITVIITDGDLNCPKSAIKQYELTVICGENCPASCPSGNCDYLVASYTGVNTTVPQGNGTACLGEEITVVPSNGTSPYIYNWSDCYNCNTPIRDLCDGTYTVDITDSEGCSITLTIIVDNQGGSHAKTAEVIEENIGIYTIEMQAFPNPFDQKLTIQYKLESNGSLSNNIPIKIDAYHITGKTNFTIFEGDMNVGEQGEYILEASYLPIGMYIFRLETPDKVKIIKAIKH